MSRMTASLPASIVGAALAMALCATLLPLAGLPESLAEDDGVVETIRARNFVLLDHAGNKRLTMGTNTDGRTTIAFMTAGGGHLWLAMDQGGVPSIAMSAPSDSCDLFMTAEKERGLFRISRSDGTPCLLLDATQSGSGGLAVLDEKLRVRCEIGVSPLLGKSSLLLSNREHSRTVQAEVSGEGPTADGFIRVVEREPGTSLPPR